MTTVQVFLNVDRDHFDGWQPGHPMVRVFAYDTDERPAGQLAEEAFAMFNGFPDTADQLTLTEAYYDRRLRSLSVGDAIKIGETVWACASIGFQPISGDLNDVTTSYDSDGAVVVPLPRAQELQ